MPAEPSPAVMRRLWQVMAEVYGHRWTSAYGDDAGASTGRTWAKGLTGLTPTQIGHGLDAAIVSSDEWPPSLPAFRALCLAVPAFASVRAELAARDSRRSPFARLVWLNLDTHRWRTADADRGDRLLREAYDMAREHVMRGGELPEPVAEITHSPEPRRPASAETARHHIDTIAASLGAVDASSYQATACADIGGACGGAA